MARIANPRHQPTVALQEIIIKLKLLLNISNIQIKHNPLNNFNTFDAQ